MINFISRIVFMLGVKKRNPSFLDSYSNLLKTDYAEQSEIIQIQRSRLKDLLVFANNHSSFYKDRFDQVGLNFNRDFDPFEYLRLIDTVTKSELISENERIHTIKNYQFKKLFFSETSGSSGEPLTFWKNEEWDSINRASIARGMSWYGVNLWDRNGYFWGYSFSFLGRLKTSLLDFLQNRFRLFSYYDNDIDKFVKKAKKAKYIHGYSSMIYEVAKKLTADGTMLKNLKLVKGTSEKIYDHYQDAATKAFGQKIVSEYGSAEAGIIAFECPHGSMHINEENCIVEVVESKIVVTNLASFSFPIIRYELGDYISLSDTKCKCGRSHKIINEVLGRVGKSIVGKNGSSYPSLTLYYIFKVLALDYGVVLNYKAEQHVVGKLKFLLDREITDKELVLINEVSKSYFSDALEIEIIPNVLIHDKKKKLKDFESYI
ncbi:hypothetical protein [Aliidiomarina quisquiliarum]|uniref:hypothetical protein n=1 Tax=Aliidiomarina quisquiliarum TaxID=2938947 RepID=UPI00208F8FDA|nr:hypothetical protein [Aliidiomarina quisquiliarum]MCO4322419.1 hypothetical protein [Aliidiomarina quisquiliarum]